MKKIDAYTLSDGSVHGSYALAQKAAQHRYDNLMTMLRHQLTKHLDSHAAGGMAMEWIEQNYLAISAAHDLSKDRFLTADESTDDDPQCSDRQIG